jgi:hypothetical protein
MRRDEVINDGLIGRLDGHNYVTVAERARSVWSSLTMIQSDEPYRNLVGWLIGWLDKITQGRELVEVPTFLTLSFQS